MGWEPVPIILDPRWWNELPELPNLVAQISVLGGDNSRVEDGGTAWIGDPAQGFGSPARVEFVVRNVGREPAAAFFLRARLYHEDSGVAYIDRTEEVPGLLVGFNVALPGALTGRFGRYRAELGVDTKNSVREQFESDNSASMAFDLSPVPG